MNDKITKILELRRKGYSPSRISINVNLSIDVVRWILEENIQEVKKDNGNIRVVVNTKYQEVTDMLIQDGFKESAEGFYEISVDLNGLKALVHNFQVLGIREARIIW